MAGGEFGTVNAAALPLLSVARRLPEGVPARLPLAVLPDTSPCGLGERRRPFGFRSSKRAPSTTLRVVPLPRKRRAIAYDVRWRRTPTPNPSPQGGGGPACMPAGHQSSAILRGITAAKSPSPLWGGVRGGGTAPPNVAPYAICDCPARKRGRINGAVGRGLGSSPAKRGRGTTRSVVEGAYAMAQPTLASFFIAAGRAEALWRSPVQRGTPSPSRALPEPPLPHRRGGEEKRSVM